MTECAHVWTTIRRYNRCEIDEADPIQHTSVVMLGCQRCRSVEAFPPGNAALITTRYRAQMRDELKQDDWFWK